MLVLNSDEIRQVLPMRDAIEAMRRALAALSGGRTRVPARTHVQLKENGTTLVMPGYVDDQIGESLAVKIVSVFNGNQQRGLPNILGVVNVFDPETGEPIALLNGSTVTALRTAAASAVATDLLASIHASRLAIIGAGAQARSHFHAICAVRDIRQVKIFAPHRDRVDAMIGELETDIPVTGVDQASQATCDADIVCTVTNSPVPVIEDVAIPSGCHINAIGSYKPLVVEIPSATVARARVFVDHLPSAIDEAGDLIQAIACGHITAEHIAGEIGQVVLGELSGRHDDKQITLFKSVGHTVEDVVASQAIVTRARKLGIGTVIHLGD